MLAVDIAGRHLPVVRFRRRAVWKTYGRFRDSSPRNRARDFDLQHTTAGRAGFFTGAHTQPSGLLELRASTSQKVALPPAARCCCSRMLTLSASVWQMP